jgi:hypothetical protein
MTDPLRTTAHTTLVSAEHEDRCSEALFTVRIAGLQHETMKLRLAIAPADAKWCHVEMRGDGSARFRGQQAKSERWRGRYAKRLICSVPAGTFEPFQWGWVDKRQAWPWALSVWIDEPTAHGELVRRQYRDGADGSTAVPPAACADRLAALLATEPGRHEHEPNRPWP